MILIEKVHSTYFVPFRYKSKHRCITMHNVITPHLHIHSYLCHTNRHHVKACPPPLPDTPNHLHTNSLPLTIDYIGNQTSPLEIDNESTTLLKYMM